jgi:CDP-paratose 2-epimerase
MNNRYPGGHPDHGSAIGISEWFHVGEYERVRQVLDDLKELGITELRIGFSWADWHTSQGKEWYRWLMPRLAQEVNVLPCFHYTPPSLAVAPTSAAPPRNPKAYADFLDVMITEFGNHFQWMELWNEPNNLNDWDWRLDPRWHTFCEMMGMAAHWAKQRGKNTVLGGTCPTDVNWLRLMCHRGLMRYIDVVGVHGFPGTWDFTWEEWEPDIEKIQALLDEFGLESSIWITEAGFSTWKHEEYEQVQSFIQAVNAPAERVYWYSAHDLHPDVPTQEGLLADPRHYHMGLREWNGTPKLLYRLWASGGLPGVENAARLYEHPTPPPNARRKGNSDDDDTVLITGGVGFVGTNLAHRLLSSGQRVRIFDSLARPGVERNMRWLQAKHGDLLQVEIADVRNRHRLHTALRDVSQVFHFAAQVAVTSSLASPIHDFEVNARGMLNLLEEMRALPTPPPLVFTSTNKVYGSLSDVELMEGPSHYEPVDRSVRLNGISERHPLDFHSPYGCSKGVADQYVLDYTRSFGLSAVVFRMSCIYGPHQFGTEDQGWVAHFLLQGLNRQPVTIYGDGKQVRDILFVDDLVDALLLAQARMNGISGQAFNIGGGPDNIVSLLELLDSMSELDAYPSHVDFAPWRAGDQRYYVSDYSKFRKSTGWTPKVSVHDGVRGLLNWLRQANYEAASLSGGR